MTIYTTAEKLDMILRFCLEHKNEIIPIARIKKELFPDLVDDEIKILLRKIDSKEDKVASIELRNQNSIIISNGLTKSFLNSGGFTQEERNEEKELEETLTTKKLENELTKSNLEANKRNETYAKRNHWATIINIIIGLINIGLVIYQLIFNT